MVQKVGTRLLSCLLEDRGPRWRVFVRSTAYLRFVEGRVGDLTQHNQLKPVTRSNVVLLEIGVDGWAKHLVVFPRRFRSGVRRVWGNNNRYRCSKVMVAVATLSYAQFRELKPLIGV